MKHHIFEKLKRLEVDTQKVFASIEHLDEEQLKDATYGWSIVQVFEHLNQSETMSLVYMKKKMQAGDAMAIGGAMNQLRMRLTNLALKTSLKWKAPAYIAYPEQSTLEDVTMRWANTRKQINTFVEAFPEHWLNRLVYKHPMGGRQTLEKAVDSFIYHQQHHVHQIERIKKRIGS